jgi:uncharacterized delta-60 repeat protein
MVTIKYDQSGVQKWVKRYNGPGNGDDEAYGIAVDGSGNVYVAGYSTGSGTGPDYTVVKYSNKGAQKWVRSYDGPGKGDDRAWRLAVDGSSNVFVTGYSRGSGTGLDMATIKFNSSGVQQWLERYNGPENEHDWGHSISVDSSGNVYVGGASVGQGTGADWAVIKYDINGVQQWLDIYSGPGNDKDWVSDMALDSTGNLYVTGYSAGQGSGNDYLTMKYTSSGTREWLQRFDGTGHGDEMTHAIALDGSGNVYITGYSTSGEDNLDYVTIKYDSRGVQKWTRKYNGPGNGLDEAYDIALDAPGNVYVTGKSVSVNGREDIVTIKYNKRGAQVWIKTYNGPANWDDVAYSVAVDSWGNIYVAGFSTGISSGMDCTTIKY